MNLLFRLTSLLIIILLIGCNPKYISHNNIDKYNYTLVTADNDYEITMPQLYSSIYKSKLMKNGGILDTLSIRKFIDSTVVDSLVGFDADTIDIKQNYDKWKLIKKKHYENITRAFYAQEVEGKVKIDSIDAYNYYHDNPEAFLEEEQIDLFHILLSRNNLLNGPDSSKYKGLSPDEFKTAGMEYAQSIRDQIDSKESFIETAKKYSNDKSTAHLGGYVGWTTRGIYLNPFDSIAFSLNDGEISETYSDKDGWHILYCDKHQAEGLQPWDKKHYWIAFRYYLSIKINEYGGKLVDSILKDIDIVYNEPLMNSNLFYANDRLEWLVIVNGIDTIDVNEGIQYELNLKRKYSFEETNYEQKKAMLYGQISKLGIVQAARDIKIDTLPDIVVKFNALKHKFARTVIEKERYDIYWRPGDSLIEDYYNKNIDKYLVKKPLVVQHIIVQDSILGEFLRDQALSGIDFLELAKEYYPGEESIRMDLANLGEISKDDVPEEFYDRAIKLMTGDVSHPVKTEFGYHVIKIIEKRSTMRLDAASIKINPILRKLHMEETFNIYRDNIYLRYNVQKVGKIHPFHLKPKSLRK